MEKVLQWGGDDVHVHRRECPSTHEWLQSHFQEIVSALAGEGDVFALTCDHQTNGVGTYNKNNERSRWVDNSRLNLKLSMITKIPYRLALCFAPNTLSLLTALIVAEHLTVLLPEIAGELAVKWPNDIYYKKKKLSGVLVGLPPVSANGSWSLLDRVTGREVRTISARFLESNSSEEDERAPTRICTCGSDQDKENDSKHCDNETLAERADAECEKCESREWDIQEHIYGLVSVGLNVAVQEGENQVGLLQLEGVDNEIKALCMRDSIRHKLSSELRNLTKDRLRYYQVWLNDHMHPQTAGGKYVLKRIQLYPATAILADGDTMLEVHRLSTLATM